MTTSAPEFVLTMLDHAQGGDAFAYYEGKMIFVAGALPQEEVKVRLGAEHPTFFTGELLEILKPSPDRAPNFCAHGCGSCSYTCVRYEAELQDKRRRLAALYASTKEANIVMQAPIHAMSDPFAYRNKSVCACSTQGGKLTIGLYARGSHDIIPLASCALEARWMTDAREKISSFFAAQDQNIAPNLRYIFLRGADEGERMCVLVFYAEPSADFIAKVASLYSELKLSSLKININNLPGNRILGPKFIQVAGKETIETSILGNKFAINAESFLQINPTQAEVMYKRALELLAPKATDVVADLYSGAGTISLYVAKKVAQVIGVECVDSAVNDAKSNAKLNGITNVEFKCGLVEKIFPQLAAQGIKIDSAILDPARKGAAPEVFQTLAAFGVQRFVYISCNPISQKRDLEVAVKYGYELRAFEAVDMFPHTDHVETVVLMSRVNGQ